MWSNEHGMYSPWGCFLPHYLMCRSLVVMDNVDVLSIGERWGEFPFPALHTSLSPLSRMRASCLVEPTSRGSRPSADRNCASGFDRAHHILYES